ncbi:hypothetical protein EUTSA_v10001202mg [Eutrema salsugineum]|uniref:Pectinesterase inhibitor domain-containing protein n=1 Tax=Eutrema salsugineum TaxID=72664 RepID=V4N3I7_EUTSA|nr:pectinesterase inhibitor 12 [Eutrema salsugineum]ESQ39846.1 hypothetical protein EUTSA_v10001202mg [Eutrema salsugineum]
MKFFIYLVMFIIHLSGIITANNVIDSLIRDSCKKASKYEESEQDYYNLCITSIKENPETQKARNIDDLIVVGVKNAMVNTTNVKGILEKILKERKYKSKLSAKLMRDCIKLYSNGIDSLTKALKFIKMRDYRKVSDNISDARAAPRTCEMGFNGDNNQTSPVTKENDVLFQMADIPQAFNYDSHLDTPTV